MTVNNGQPATDKQLRLMTRLDLKFNPSTITSFEASRMIDAELQRRNSQGAVVSNAQQGHILPRPSPGTPNSNGMRVGMCMNNAVQLAIANLHKGLIPSIDLDAIARDAKHLMTIAKTLERE